ncbi:MAG: hypothetical protein B6245_00285 [Desulfobacteraceae bacterium 4572_88]|nr:MAG: hypothetical protein B6245_00285 [Desulfobacteraceae bacterium 4572_88]
MTKIVSGDGEKQLTRPYLFSIFILFQPSFSASAISVHQRPESRDADKRGHPAHASEGVSA